MYTVVYMLRLQIYISERQRAMLERKAKASGASIAALIRRAIDRSLGLESEQPDRTRILAETFGAIPDLEVPARSSRFDARANR